MSSKYRIPCGEVQVLDEGSGCFDKLAPGLSRVVPGLRCPLINRQEPAVGLEGNIGKMERRELKRGEVFQMRGELYFLRMIKTISPHIT